MDWKPDRKAKKASINSLLNILKMGLQMVHFRLINHYHQKDT